AFVAAGSVRPCTRRRSMDAFVALHTARTRAARPARGHRRVRVAPPVRARARPRVAARESRLLQLLREHAQASALPVCEPAGALRALGGRDRRAVRPRAAAARTYIPTPHPPVNPSNKLLQGWRGAALLGAGLFVACCS